MVSSDAPRDDAPRGLSFSSSGLLLTYHLGVAQALAQERWERVLGVSGGAVVALLLCVCPEKLEWCREHLRAREWAKGMTMADVWDPAARMLPAFLRSPGLLPPDAAERASGRLCVLCTRKRGREVVRFEQWATTDELIATVQASCSFAWSGVALSDGHSYWDGGMGKGAKLLEVLPGLRTVTVAPVSGCGATICPAHTGGPCITTRYGHLSWRNVVRGWDVCFPRSAPVMDAHVAAGLADGRAWLQSDGRCYM